MMTSSAVRVQWWEIKIISTNNEAMLLKLCRDVAPYKIYQIAPILMLLWQHAGFPTPASPKLNITICDSARQNIWCYLRRFRLFFPCAATNDNVWFCRGKRLESCCHSNAKMCTIWYISYSETSLPSFYTIASLLEEIFWILRLTTVLARPMNSFSN